MCRVCCKKEKKNKVNQQKLLAHELKKIEDDIIMRKQRTN